MWINYIYSMGVGPFAKDRSSATQRNRSLMLLFSFSFTNRFINLHRNAAAHSRAVQPPRQSSQRRELQRLSSSCPRCLHKWKSLSGRGASQQSSVALWSRCASRWERYYKGSGGSTAAIGSGAPHRRGDVAAPCCRSPTSWSGPLRFASLTLARQQHYAALPQRVVNIGSPSWLGGCRALRTSVRREIASSSSSHK